MILTKRYPYRTYGSSSSSSKADRSDKKERKREKNRRSNRPRDRMYADVNKKASSPSIFSRQHDKTQTLVSKNNKQALHGNFCGLLRRALESEKKICNLPRTCGKEKTLSTPRHAPRLLESH
jgi:hypothetical protein